MAQHESQQLLLVTTDAKLDETFRRIAAEWPCDVVEQEFGDQESNDQQTNFTPGMSLEVVDERETTVQAVRTPISRHAAYALVVLDAASFGGDNLTELVNQLLDSDCYLYVLLLSEETPDRYLDAEQGDDFSQRCLVVSRSSSIEQLRQATLVQLERRDVGRRLLRQQRDLLAMSHRLEQADRRADEADRLKNEFMANVSHELRTPMNAILGFSRLLLNEPLNENQLTKVRRVHDGGVQLHNTIDNILDFSQLLSGALQLRVTTFDLDNAVRNILEHCYSPAQEKGLAISCHSQGSVPRRLQGDGARFEQILGNLVSNAVKFTKAGSVHIQIMLDDETDTTATLRVVVTDTGCGIPPDRESIIFKRFAQADGSSSRHYEGLGLGLTIAKHLVKKMDGQIGCRSEPGKGSTFWFTATFVKPDSDDDLYTDAQEGSSRSLLNVHWEATRVGNAKPITRRRILVAETDPLDRTLIEMFLTREGCVVDCATDGRETLAMLRTEQHDLVFLNIRLPELDGLTVLNHLRHEETASRHHIAAIIMADSITERQKQAFMDAGADACLAKPLAPHILVGTVNRFLPPENDEQPDHDTAISPSDNASQICKKLGERLEDLQKLIQDESFHRLETDTHELERRCKEAAFNECSDNLIRLRLAARSQDGSRAAKAIESIRRELVTFT